MPVSEETAPQTPKRGFSVSGLLLTGGVGMAGLESLEQPRPSTPSPAQPTAPSSLTVADAPPVPLTSAGPQPLDQEENRNNLARRLNTRGDGPVKWTGDSEQHMRYRCSLCHGLGHNMIAALTIRRGSEKIV